VHASSGAALKFNNRKYLATVSAILLICLAGCLKRDDLGKVENANLVWPQSPEPARIRFVAAYGTPRDLGVRNGLIDFILGRKQTVRIQKPVDVAPLENGSVAVADLSGSVFLLNPETRVFRHQWKAVDGPLVSPVAVAPAPNGGVYLVDSQIGAVILYDTDLTPVRIVANCFQRPAGISVMESTGDIFVADALAGHVVRLDSMGTPVDTIGSYGDGEAQFNTPTHVWLQGDELLVTDSYHFRISRYSLEGDYLSSFGKPGQVPGSFARPKGVAADGAGNVYVVDALFDNVQIFDPDGQLLLFFGNSGGLAAGEFSLPNGLSIDDNNMIYVADTYHGRIQVFESLSVNSGNLTGSEE